ncbi:MAG: hypothetical protein LBB74_05845 [Chitinispirillales bacterium]|jgi:hypothetical protein|nr:hypothetical protein [Chitinispirillales bacterium]
MPLVWDEIQERALSFSKRWKNGQSEEAEGQSFIRDLLYVFGVKDPLKVGTYEYKVLYASGASGFGKIDYLWKGKIAIEMKSRGENLSAAYRQLYTYISNLPEEEKPELWLVCDFETIRVRSRFSKKHLEFKTSGLYRRIKLFAEIAGYGDTERVVSQKDVDVKAAEKMALLHDAMKNCGYGGHALEVYLVRLLFCLFADNTGIFPKGSFLRYVEESKPNGADLSERLAKLFEVLNMPEDARAARKLLSDDLRQFRYINGNLFKDSISIAEFDAKMRQTLIDCAKFDWSGISPAIFGAMFQGVMDKNLRRELGAHYTSEENILKLIRPLFLDDLRREFKAVKADPGALDAFHDKISQLKFLDPACGCGNFLIVTYRELRELELDILKMKINTNQLQTDISYMFKVTVEQFYGIEIVDFPCQVATVGMWLADHQMNMLASEMFGQYIARLPLTQSATVVHGNAMRVKWEDIVPKNELSYILGNPPFAGARLMTPAQKEDIQIAFGSGYRSVGNLDYVTAWYKRAAEYIKDTKIYAAFVSTNSITQGEQVALLWKPLFDEHGIEINFAYRTFRWDNEAKGRAAVFCVIIGFSVIMAVDSKLRRFDSKRFIYNEDGEKINANVNINPYLIDALTVFINSRERPLCDVPEIGIGNKPIDGGNYLFTAEERKEFLKIEPAAKKWFRKWIGSDEFLNGYFRYCLWLGDCPSDELRKMPECMKRVKAVRQYRLASKSAGTRKLAETPCRFHVENMPKTEYIAIPETSSERRKYIPIGFISPNILSSNALRIIPGAKLYHFGILTSSVHNIWTRAVCGRLEMRYRYSKDIVYNNFPWPDADSKQTAKIEELAQAVLDARADSPDCSLAVLYDPLTMPRALLKAHDSLDRAVVALYGFAGGGVSEEGIAAKLMGIYKSTIANADEI